jgi:toxin ParE1/3/4
MPKIIWKPQAEKDLKAIEEYYKKTAPDFAQVFVAQVHQKLDRVELFPLSGRMVPEINDPAIREIIYRGYRIVYHYIPDTEPVEILTVFNSSQQFGHLDF